MPSNALHAAAGGGRLAVLAAELTAKDAEGTLDAGAPCRAPPNSPCPLSPVAAALAERDVASGRGV